MSKSDVAWMRICKRVWNTKLEAGSDGTRWCSDDQEDFLRSVEPEFKSSNMLLTDCINHIKRWFSTQCTENGSMKLSEESDDEDESIVQETDQGEDAEVSENRTEAVVTKKGAVEEWQPRMHQKVLAPVPIDGNSFATMVGRKMESSAMRDDIHTVQNFEAMVVHVNEVNKTVGLNYYGIGGYHPSVRWSVLNPKAKNSADGEREKQLAKGSDLMGSQSRVVTVSKKDCKDDLKLKMEEFATDRKKELDRFKADVMSEMHHQINEMKKEVTSTGLVMHGINGDLTDIKNRMKALLEKAQQGKQLASMGSDKAIKDIQKSVASHEQKFDAVEIKVDTEVKRVEGMVTALSATASTVESHQDCLTRLEKMEDLVVGAKRKVDRIYTAIRTMADVDNDVVEKETDSEKDNSSGQTDVDKAEGNLDGSHSPQLARRRGGGGGRCRGRGRGRGRGGGGDLRRFQVAPSASEMGEGA